MCSRLLHRVLRCFVLVLTLVPTGVAEECVDYRDFARWTASMRPASCAEAMDVAIEGSYVYIVCQDGLHVADALDPTAPALVGTFSTPDDALALDVKNGVAAVASMPRWLHLVDVTNPGDPILLDEITMVGRGR